MLRYFAILCAINIILCLGLGAFTASRNPRHPANLSFAASMLVLCVIEAGNLLVLISMGEGGAGLEGMRLILTGGALLPAALLVFSLSFARAGHKESLSRNKGFITVFALASAVFASMPWMSAYPALVMAVSPDAHPLLSIAAPYVKYQYIFMILGLAIGLLQLENTFRSSSGDTRWRIKYVIFGTGAVMAFFIYLSSQTLLYSSIMVEYMPVASMVIAVSVSMMGVFIVRHRLMDVDIFISRYVVYNSLTVLVIGIYLLATAAVAQGIKYFKVPLGEFFTASFVFLAILFLFVLLFTSSLKKKAQAVINRHFYKHKYEFRDKWMETIEKISSKRSVEEIRSTVTEMISETMGVREVFVWLHDPVANEYVSHSKNLPPELRRIKPGHPLVSAAVEKNGPFTLETGSGAYELRDALLRTGASLCAPLVSVGGGSSLIGFILQGRSFSGEPYRADDFELLKAVSTQAAVQIANIRLLEDLSTAREVEAFSAMSSFIMHDLKNLTNSLSLISHNARDNMNNPEFQQDAIRTIEGIVTRMKGVIGKLSALPMALDVKKAPADLRAVIEGAIKKVPARTKEMTIRFEAEPMPPVKIDPEAMEMVFLNLIKNACEAIKDNGTIEIDARMNTPFAVVSVKDDGAGIHADFLNESLFRPFRTTKKGGLGVGLFQCKSMVEAHGGRIEVESAPGQGTVFRVILPAQQDEGTAAHDAATGIAG